MFLEKWYCHSSIGMKPLSGIRRMGVLYWQLWKISLFYSFAMDLLILEWETDILKKKG
jgi:hypothetical protein